MPNLNLRSTLYSVFGVISITFSMFRHIFIPFYASFCLFYRVMPFFACFLPVFCPFFCHFFTLDHLECFKILARCRVLFCASFLLQNTETLTQIVYWSWRNLYTYRASDLKKKTAQNIYITRIFCIEKSRL